jgi:hypothetical protein
MTPPADHPAPAPTRGRALARAVSALEYAAVASLLCMLGLGVAAFTPAGWGLETPARGIRACFVLVAVMAVVGAIRPQLTTPAGAARRDRDELATLLVEAEDALREAAAAASGPLPPLLGNATPAETQVWKLKAQIREMRAARWPDPYSVLAGRIHDYRIRHNLYAPGTAPEPAREDTPQ